MTEKARDARPPQRAGSSRRSTLGGPNPGASRRLCPGRYARALTDFVFEEDPR